MKNNTLKQCQKKYRDEDKYREGDEDKYKEYLRLNQTQIQRQRK